MYKINRLFRLLVLVTVILALPATTASAALVRCRLDPIFVLSNGDIVNVTVDIGTDPAQVTNIHYVLHVPAGVTVKEVIHTGRGLRIHETTRVYQDSPAGGYLSDTVVSTRSPAGTVPVTAYVRLNGVPVQSIFGYNGQNLILTVNR